MQPRKEHYRRKMPHYQHPGQWYSVTIILKGAMPKRAMKRYSIQLETARTHYQLLLQKLGFSGTGVFNSCTWDMNFPNKSVKENFAVGKSESQNLESQLEEAKKEYQIALRKYRLAYDKILKISDLQGISLVKEENRKVIEEALTFWEGKRLTSHAWCIMSNHIHWVLSVFEKEQETGRESEFPNSDNAKLQFGNPQSHQKPVYLQDILHSVKLFTARRINENENRTGQLWENESFDTTIRNDRHFVNVVNYTLQNPVSAGLIKDWKDWPGTRIFGDMEIISQ